MGVLKDLTRRLQICRIIVQFTERRTLRSTLVEFRFTEEDNPSLNYPSFKTNSFGSEIYLEVVRYQKVLRFLYLVTTGCLYITLGTYTKFEKIIRVTFPFSLSVLIKNIMFYKFGYIGF